MRSMEQIVVDCFEQVNPMMEGGGRYLRDKKEDGQDFKEIFSMSSLIPQRSVCIIQ